MFSGSSESLRQVARGYYGDLGGNGDISFEEANMVSNINGVLSVTETETDLSTTSILPRIRYASRLFVDESIDFLSDQDWKTFIIGGSYGNSTYTGLYNDAVYSDHANTSSLPYTPREIVNISEDVLSPSLSLTTEYYNYYPRFQLEVAGLDSALQAPNYYMLESSSYLVPSYNSEIVQSKYQYSNLDDFLTDGYVNSDKIMNTDLENIFILDGDNLQENNGIRRDTADLLEHGDFDSDLSSLYSLMPFGNKLELTADLLNTPNDFRTIIEDNNFEVKFVKLLKEIFQGESRLSTSTINFAVNTQAETSTGILTGSLQTTTTIPVRIVDAPTMLLYSYRNPLSETDNITIFNSSSYKEQVDYAMDTTGIYRYENTDASLSTLNDFVNEIKSKFNGSEGSTPINTYPLQTFLNEANTPKYHETVAFRIEKIGGSPTGDSRTQNTIQNIWFYNNDQAIAYLDTQVKYDTDYTYNVYKYDIVQGYKYQLSDVVTTRQIATESSGDSTVYCLEFYNPFTNDTSPQLLQEGRSNVITETQPIIDAFLALSSSVSMRQSELLNTESDINDVFDNTTNGLDYIYGYDREFIDGFDNDPESLQIHFSPDVVVLIGTYFLLLELFNLQATNLALLEDQYEAALPEYEELLDLRSLNLQNDLTGSSQTTTIYPYLADFNTTIEPSVKIIEIPIEQKRMRIVDHPPNDLVVTPHHLLDQTNRLAFYCKYDTFSMNSVTYPPTLTTRDTQNKSAYLGGHDFVNVSEQTQESVSRARFIEVYRTTTKPTDYEDLSGHLRTTIDLLQSNGDIVTDHFFTERVRENVIYYYAFRAINENRVSGQFSPVIESELINDGGYVYGRFEQYSEEDLQVSAPREPLSAFKKLLNIVPNVQHLELDTSAVNFDNSSSTEIDNVTIGASNVVDPLFNTDSDRYFKIRLTSKKTGRKLDINIGFKKEVRK